MHGILDKQYRIYSAYVYDYADVIVRVTVRFRPLEERYKKRET